ncbi:MAG: phenylalanine--tRNA ligase subunit alpha [Candidatus Diapherotrites archaeon]
MSLVSSLSEIEKCALKVLSSTPIDEAKVSELAGISVDSARRALAWLCNKGLAKSIENVKKSFVLTNSGSFALSNGLPERIILVALSKFGSLSFDDLLKKTGLSQAELSAGLGSNKRNAFVSVVKNGSETLVSITEVGKAYLNSKSPLEESLLLVSNGVVPEIGNLNELLRRGLVKEKEIKVRTFVITDFGISALGSPEFSSERVYNIHDPVPEIFIGKKQPYVVFLETIRRKLVQLGFKEMVAPLVVHEFYNFDVLFQPQNHPARSWTDTYQLKNPSKGVLVDRRAVSAVKAAHENGGVSGSKGWGYSWSEEIASKLMPVAHGTAHSARQLVSGVEIPGKYFAIARCFRPDVLDSTHLIEFNQTEGFVVGPDLNFRHLLGMLEQFAVEVAGAKEVKFVPDYYPFTEPSVQLSAKHPDLGWIELGGAGMFRPEILCNLGINAQAIAWGLGIDRLAMFKLGIKDIRFLFSDDLNWLRFTPAVFD